MIKRDYLFAAVMIWLLLAIALAQACKKENNGEGMDPTPNLPPACDIVFPEDGAEFIIGDTVQIQAAATDPDGKLKMVQFFINGSLHFADTSVPYVLIWNTVQDTVGNYVIKAVAFDNLDTNRSDEINIFLKEEITGKAPVANFSAIPPSGYIPHYVTFSDLSTNEPTEWKWDFGDGYVEGGQNPLHVYLGAGTYTVTLTVSNEFGSDTKSMEDYVEVWVNAGTSGSFTDPRDGNVYNTIEINGRLWFSENLNYDTEDSWYYADSAEYEEYGRLYTWFAAWQACPEGWHLPSDKEWREMEIYLGMSEFDASFYGYRGTREGKMLKSSNGWFESGNGNNASGFNAIGAGAKYYSSTYLDLTMEGHWWTGTYSTWPEAWDRSLRYSDDRIGRFPRLDSYGLSVRCVKD